MTAPMIHPTERLQSESEDEDHFQVLHCAITLSIVLLPQIRSKKNPAVTKFPKHKPSFDEFTSVHSDGDFRNAFWMSRHSFYKLFHTLRQSGLISERSLTDLRSIPGEVRVAVGLRIMAGATVHDPMIAYKISKTSVHTCFKQFLAAVTKTMTLPGLPESRLGLEKLELGFKKSRSCRNPLSGYVGALNGVLVRIRKPRWYESPASFFCRKGFYSLPVQALVDAKYWFLDFSGLAVGTTNDALAFMMSPLARYLEAGKLLRGFYIVADNAYTLLNSLISPFPGKKLPDFKSATKFFLSSRRIHVEQVFGIMKRRWRVFYNGQLNYEVKDCVPIIAAGMILHNFCIDNDGQVEYVYSESEVAETKEDSRKWHEMVEREANKTESSVLDRRFIRNLLLRVISIKRLLRPTVKL